MRDRAGMRASGPGRRSEDARIRRVGSFTIKVSGKAAHSGLDFEKGHSAILELAHQVQAISGSPTSSVGLR